MKTREPVGPWNPETRLYPLEEPCLETVVNGVSKKRWAYRGFSLLQDDVDRLTKKGVDWERDIMPDGRLKSTRFRLKRINNRRKALAAAAADTKVETDELKTRYDALPEPRPPYFQWAAQEEVSIHYESVKRIAMHSVRDSDRIKALSVLLEHGLAKPKQTLAVEQKESGAEIPAEKFLEAALEHNGFSMADFKAFVASKQTVQ